MEEVTYKDINFKQTVKLYPVYLIKQVFFFLFLFCDLWYMTSRCICQDKYDTFNHKSHCQVGLKYFGFSHKKPEKK